MFMQTGAVQAAGFDGQPMTSPSALPVTWSQAPVVTGGSVLGLVYDGGVMLLADILGSYGSLARFRDCRRLMKVNDGVLLGAAGDYADFQYLKAILERKIIEDRAHDDKFSMKPASVLSYLTRILYNRRSQFDPFWNTFVVAGIQDGKPFLGSVDKIGTCFQDTQVATSLGAHLAIPLLRDRVEKYPKMTEKQAREALLDAFRILLYRDCSAFPKFEIAKITAEGIEVEAPQEVSTNWNLHSAVH
ncbi:unnamed protein product [Notodromas monacha]|uniref:Proteasome subunit beta n=1 Tax=Notodromas monacha TaxID=399045 RepID=A0A7R9BP05_9CRUS|nr:unnamed protein product [Notodromas monacha]CAG0918176.1 unnamed protein product [Notodromas monacha]